MIDTARLQVPARCQILVVMGNTLSLSNHFLIAMPGLADPNFSRTVTLICEHNEDGAMGITVNRLLDLSLRNILQEIQIPASSEAQLDRPVYLGGPVQSHRGFVLHEPAGNWDSTLIITERLGVSTSRDILEALAQDQGPAHCIIALGYAGWGPGQLEQELADNAWLSGPATNEILFQTPIEDRWTAAAHLLGVDLSSLSHESGHA